MAKIKKGDTVKVISGDYKGKVGKVLKYFPKDNTVIVEKVQFIKRHQRRRTQTEPGGILELEAPINISKVMLVCPNCNKATRVGFTFLADGRKVRKCKVCDEMIFDKKEEKK